MIKQLSRSRSIWWVWTFTPAFISYVVSRNCVTTFLLFYKADKGIDPILQNCKDFALLQVEIQTIFCPVWSPSVNSSNPFGWFFPRTWVVSPYAWTDWVSAEESRETLSRVLYLSLQLSSLVLCPHEFSHFYMPAPSAQLKKTTRCHPGSFSWCCGLETLPRQDTGEVTGPILRLFSFSWVTVLGCLIVNV